MRNFKVIKTQQKPKPDYPSIYAKVLINSLKKKPDPATKDWICKHVYLSVKGLPIMWIV